MAPDHISSNLCTNSSPQTHVPPPSSPPNAEFRPAWAVWGVRVVTVTFVALGRGTLEGGPKYISNVIAVCIPGPLSVALKTGQFFDLEFC